MEEYYPLDSEQFIYEDDGNWSDYNNYETYVYEFFSNSTNGTTPSSSIPIPIGRMVAICLFALLFIIGIVGNSLVISTVIRFGGMRKVTYLYLVNLAAVDLLYLLICLSTLTASYALVGWPFGLFFCEY